MHLPCLPRTLDFLLLGKGKWMGEWWWEGVFLGRGRRWIERGPWAEQGQFFKGIWILTQ